jgi:arsenite methyltransferase
MRPGSGFRQACSEHRLSLHEATMTALPLADGSVDALITVNTVYFVEDVELAFAEIARVLRPSGRAVVGIGDPSMMARLPFTPHGFRLRPVEQLVSALGGAGLGQVRHERVGQGERAFHLLVAARG